jgi:phosphoglycerate dehydrogenase-like enzyme/predicted dehydrogenase
MCSARKTLRVLVIGAGPMADIAHLPALARLRDRGEVSLIIVCDLNAQRMLEARRKFGFVESSGDAVACLMREDIDAVYIFGSAQMHYEYGLLALKHNKHLFVEKPIAASYGQAVELAESARSRGMMAVAGLNRRFYGSINRVRELSGSTRWRYAEAVFHKAEFRNSPSFGAHTFLSANGIHALDTLLFMMQGLPVELTSIAANSGVGPNSAFSALMRWQDGAQGVFLCNNDAGARREEYAFHNLGESFRIDDSGVTAETNNRMSKTPLPAIGDGIVAEHEAFLRAIHSGAQPIHSIEAIAPSMFLAELIESGFSGRVELPHTPMIQPGENSQHVVPEAKILVLPSAELQPALAVLLARYGLVTIEDVLGSSSPRPDIVAAILGRGAAPLPQEVLDKLTGLSIVGIMGLSLARHQPEAMIERGIKVINASAAYAESVAEFALGLAILGRRRAFLSDAIMRSGGWGTDRSAGGFGGWLKRSIKRLRPAIRSIGLETLMLRLWNKLYLPTSGIPSERITAPSELRGATVGLIGWSENGRLFTSHLKQLGASVVVYTEHASDEDIRRAGASTVSLTEALACDVVSLHRGLTGETRHGLGEAELAKLRPGAVLINAARGALIEPGALIARLRRGDMFACLDTYEDEPPEASDPLRSLPNVFLTSHIAGGSKDMHHAAAREVVDKVAAYLAGEPVASISAERLRTMS